MIYKCQIDDFIVYTEKKEELISDKYYIQKNIEKSYGSGYEQTYCPKTRDITIFKCLDYLETTEQRYITLIDNIFDFIEIIEFMKGFSSNKLTTDKIYYRNNFTITMSDISGIKKLNIKFKKNPNSFFLEKMECILLAAKFSKILSRCEAWQEQVQ